MLDLNVFKGICKSCKNLVYCDVEYTRVAKEMDIDKIYDEHYENYFCKIEPLNVHILMDQHDPKITKCNMYEKKEK